jgi:hypothetical protein
MWSLRTPKGQVIAVARLPALVGSARDADVRVPHDSVAAEHARLSAGEDGGLIVEAIGEAIVGCNGRRVRTGTLQAGEQLILGRLRFTLVRSEASEGTRAASRPRPAATASPARPARTPAAPRKPANKPASSPARRALTLAASGTARSTRSATGPRTGGDDLLVPRSGRRLPTRRGPARSGLLHGDFSQYTISMRLLIVLALLGMCAGLVYGIGLLFGLLD